MLIRKETAGAAIFCIVNGILSMNCFFYHTVRPLSVDRYTHVQREEKRLKYVKSVLLEDGLNQKVHLHYSDGERFCINAYQKRLIRFAAEWERCESAENAVPMRLLQFEKPFPFTDPYRTAQIGIYAGSGEKILYIFFEWEKGGKVFSSGSYRWGQETGYGLVRMEEYDGKEIGRLYPPLKKAVFLQNETEYFAAVPEKGQLRYSSVYNTDFREQKNNPMYFFKSALAVPAYMLDLLTFPVQYAIYRMSRK